MPWTQAPLKTIIDQFAICARTGFSNLTPWRDNSKRVTYHKGEALVLGRHNRRLFLRVHIGAKFIFASK